MPTAAEAGLKGRCPRCGQGRLFKGLLAFEDQCEACGADFRMEDAGDGPAIFVIFLTGGIIVPLMLAFHFKLNPPLWLTLLIWLPILFIVSLALLRPLRGLMFAQQYKRNALEATRADLDE